MVVVIALLLLDLLLHSRSISAMITHPDDTEALMRIKAAIDPRTICSTSCLGTWDFSMDPCESVFGPQFTCGIKCTNDESSSSSSSGDDNRTSSTSTGNRTNSHYKRVISVVFDNAGYGGLLSPYVGNLTRLRILQLSGNFIAGVIPDTISHLSHLITLDLSANRFTGVLPKSLGSLASLQTLDFSDNNLQGTIPRSINYLTSLTSLRLQTNGLTGTIPDLRNMSSLRQLDLSGNKFSGAFPTTSLPPESISLISLRNNNFSGKLPSLLISSLTRLVVLDLSQNQFSGCVDDAILAHQSLQQVNLSNNMLVQLRAHGKQHLVESPLVALDISYNRISGRLPGMFALMKELSALSLRYNIFHGAIPQSYGVKAMANGILAKPLQRLLLDGNYLIGPLPTQFITEVPNHHMLASFGDNCFTYCPMQYAFCQGKGQKTQTICRLFNPSP